MISRLRHALAALAAAMLAGCAIPLQVREGERTVAGGAMVVSADPGWNHLAVIDRPWTTWTHDGSVLDELRFWAGMKDGDEIAPAESREQRPLSFRRTMQPHELAALFASLQARDGSVVSVDRLEPAAFVGVPGVRFRWSVLRSADDMRMSGVGWAAVREGQLYAMTFIAPRLDFFERHLARVERIARSAKAMR
jgi:hypothetical protein